MFELRHDEQNIKLGPTDFFFFSIECTQVSVSHKKSKKRENSIFQNMQTMANIYRKEFNFRTPGPN